MIGRDQVMPGAVKAVMSRVGSTASVIGPGRVTAGSVTCYREVGYGAGGGAGGGTLAWRVRVERARRGSGAARRRVSQGVAGGAYRLAGAFGALRAYLELRGFRWDSYNVEIRDAGGVVAWFGPAAAIDCGPAGPGIDGVEGE